ncbi:hypothetical protein Glove_522g83 [Diversispora epigaea]|uniref:Uncharacterized protein n=1 Tax=Diversispora epigaea TaxID=1348612 RepID=A0A397GHX9_9GLOM|nr:hypothetical protein Glove_522g83 [Diversispora epigaea]
MDRINKNKATAFSLSQRFREASSRKFSLKLLNDELSTLSNLHKRNPLLYKTNQCPFCQIEIENNIHIFTCSSQTGLIPNSLVLLFKEIMGNSKDGKLVVLRNESIDMRVYDDVIYDQQQQTKNLQICNYNMDYGSGEKRNSFNTAVYYAKHWLYAKILSEISIKGTSRFYKTN